MTAYITRRDAVFGLACGALCGSAMAFPQQVEAARLGDVGQARVRRQQLAGIKTWGYQLQRLDVAEIAASPFDLMVIDHAPDRVESVERFFRRDEIAEMAGKADGSRRLVLAYVSIGEAEHYRFYWDATWLEAATRPSWLGAVNPQWAGNYPVEFWNPAWQALIYGGSDSYVDRVLEAGFDGIYLDRADVYQQFADRPTAEADMATFVANLADYARRVNPAAIVVMQNAEELVRHKSVRGRIDAVAKESLYFNPEQAAVVPIDETQSAVADLKLAQNAGHKVLVVEYTADAAIAAAARRKAERDGFLIHFAERSLSALNTRGPDQIAIAADGSDGIAAAP